jgi:hypothetical protein
MSDVVNYIKITAGWQFKCFYKESITKKPYASGNLPPAYAEAASRRQVAPLCQIPRKAGPFVKGGQEGFSLQRPYNN